MNTWTVVCENVRSFTFGRCRIVLSMSFFDKGIFFISFYENGIVKVCKDIRAGSWKEAERTCIKEMLGI